MNSWFLAAAGQSCPSEGVVYFPDSNQCDKYFECRNGVGTEQLCPDGLLFNDKITDGRYPCFYPPEVDCGSRSQRRECQGVTQCYELRLLQLNDKSFTMM